MVIQDVVIVAVVGGRLEAVTCKEQEEQKVSEGVSLKAQELFTILESPEISSSTAVYVNKKRY